MIHRERIANAHLAAQCGTIADRAGYVPALERVAWHVRNNGTDATLDEVRGGWTGTGGLWIGDASCAHEPY